jgi:hypothetical protein
MVMIGFLPLRRVRSRLVCSMLLILQTFGGIVEVEFTAPRESPAEKSPARVGRGEREHGVLRRRRAVVVRAKSVAAQP